jgi:hypothetical protein
MNAALFSVLSLGTMGLTAGVAGLLVAVVFKYKLNKMEDIGYKMVIIVIVIAVLALLVFIFSIYASCCGKRCARCLLSLMFLLFFLGFLAFGVAVVTELNWIEYTACLKVWNDPRYEDAMKEIDNALQCKCWKDKGGLPLCSKAEPQQYTRNCYDRVHPWWQTIYWVCFGFAALLLIGVICAWGYVCCRSSETNKHQGLMYRSYD